MLVIPSVDDWFQLARKYPEFKRVNHSVLKEYGVMKCLEYIADTYGSRGKDLKVLEFGHGFSPHVLKALQDKHDVWGVDMDQRLPYFATINWEERFAREMAPHTTNVTFVRELLNSKQQNSRLPDNFFDVILSVSVLEEVGIPIVEDILRTAYKKLKPGGVLIGTHDLDLRLGETRIKEYVQAQRNAGFDLSANAPYLRFEWLTVLLENPSSVMLWYQGGMPEGTRKFWGHFATVFTVATKPLD